MCMGYWVGLGSCKGLAQAATLTDKTFSAGSKGFISWCIIIIVLYYKHSYDHSY